MSMSKSKWKSEAEFQSFCTKEFDRRYPELRGRLILQYNNPPNKVMAGILISMGMRRGVADQLFRSPVGNVWIEFKIKGGRQSDFQKDFEASVRGWGDYYELIEEDETLFFNVIKKYSNYAGE